MPQKNLTIKDIAQLAGVSIGTVDRVLHQRGEVAEVTRLRIEKILSENNYSPNLVAQALKSKKRYSIVTLLPEPSENNPFWQKHSMGLERAAEELLPFPVNIINLTFSIEKEESFISMAEDALSAKPDGILLAPFFTRESEEFCKKLCSANIPFVFIDGYIENSGFLTYVGNNFRQSGRLAGRLISMISPESDDTAFISIAHNIRNIQHLKARSDGFISYFSDKGDRRRVNAVLIDSIHEKAIREALDQLFATSPSTRSFFVTGSRSYLVAAYLRKKKIPGIRLVGYDLLDNNISCLRSGEISMLLGQRPEEQTYRGIRRLFDYLYLQRKPELMEYLPVDIVTSENADSFI